MSRIIFYSWQNDLPAKTHRNFLDRCIQDALKSLEKEAKVYMEYDRDTMGLMGSPDITESIFDKIDKSVLFVCDVSIINPDSDGKKTPNPNVLIELGYAASKLGWERIVCLFDTNTGKIEDLPFDLRQKRVTPFNPSAENERQRITKILALNIKDLFVRGKLFNPLNDYMKGKIDKAFLDIAKRLSNLLFGTYSLSEGLAGVNDLLSMPYEVLYDRMCICEFPAFIVLNTYESTVAELKDILKDILSSSYFPKEWAYCVLELLDWIRINSNITSARYPQFPFLPNKSRSFDDLAAISAQSLNPNNPPNSKIILTTFIKDGKKFVDTKAGRVINTTEYRSERPAQLTQCLVVKEESYSQFAQHIFKFTELCNQWLNTTDSEFILDPETYIIN